MNKRGFAKFEVLTVLVLLVVVSAVLLTMILKAVNNQRINMMITNAKNFSNRVVAEEMTGNSYYLKDAIKDELYEKIRSPFSSKNCDENESKIEFDGAKKYVTLKCDEYIIYKEESNSDKYSVYKVSDWKVKKDEDDDNDDDKENENDEDENESEKIQEMLGYSCKVDDKDVFNSPYEEKIFIDKVNEKYEKTYVSVSGIADCKVESQQLYRNLTLVR